jgi:hypothetical protein
VDRHAQRMTIEQRLAEQIRSSTWTRSPAWAQAAYDALRRRLPGYATARPRHHLAPLCVHQRPGHSRPYRGRGPPRRAHLQPRAALGRPARGPSPLVGWAPAPREPARSSVPWRAGCEHLCGARFRPLVFTMSTHKAGSWIRSLRSGRVWAE